MSISAKLSSLTDEQLVQDWWAGWLQFIKGLMTFYVRHPWYFLEENMKPRKQLNTAIQNTPMSRMWCKWLKVAYKLIVWVTRSFWEQFISSSSHGTQRTGRGSGLATWICERQVLIDWPDLLPWQSDSPVDEEKSVDVSTWISAKPLTLSHNILLETQAAQGSDGCTALWVRNPLSL